MSGLESKVYRLVALLLALFAILQQHEASAADLVHRNSETCEWSLEGEIVAGDSGRLTKLVWSRWPRTLCLNSSGGLFTEGVRIAEILHLEKIGTVVSPNSSCLSACAIAFMGGTSIEEEDIPFLRRTLYSTGTLGFHRPAIPLPKGGNQFYDAKTVEEAYRAALIGITLLTRWLVNTASTGSEPPFSTSLLNELLLHEGNDFFYIDTIAKAGRWKISVAGYEQPKSVTPQMAYNSCINELSWRADLLPVSSSATTAIERGAVGVFDASVAERDWLRTLDADALYEVVLDKNELVGDSLCKIVVMSETWNPVYMEGCGDHSMMGSSFGNCGRSYRDWDARSMNELAVFPPDTLLRSLPPALRHSTGVSSSGNATSPSAIYHQFSNTDSIGTDIKTVSASHHDQCHVACQDSSFCQGYTFDRWNRICILKSKFSTLITNAKSDTWIKEGNLVPRSTSDIRILKRTNRAFPDQSYKKTITASFDACSQVCSTDSMCMGINFRLPRQCELIATPSEYQPSTSSDIGYKVQLP